MKAIDLFKNVVGEEFIASRGEWTVDTVKAGREDKEVKKIACAHVASVNVLRAAIEWGADLFITHEPTFCSHLDDEREYTVARTKLKMINDADLTVFRWHDSAHFRTTDKIGEGFVKRLGLNGIFNGDMDFVLFSPISPMELTRLIEEKLDLHYVRVVGRLDGEVTKLNLCLGARGSDPFKAFREDSYEVIICGEAIEWYDFEPVRDMAELGYQKTIIALGHIGSERFAMEDLAESLNLEYAALGIEARYFDCGEVFAN